MIYLLDANAFMEASRIYYGFDLAPGFWTWLCGDPLRGRVASVRAVKDEITAGDGQLVDWAKALPEDFWVDDSTQSAGHLRTLAAWAFDPARTYNSAAVSEFLASADMRLIALAMEHDATVVTRETSAPQAQRRVKIPDACAAHGVPCVDPFTAYRALGMRLT